MHSLIEGKDMEPNTNNGNKLHNSEVQLDYMTNYVEKITSSPLILVLNNLTAWPSSLFNYRQEERNFLTRRKHANKVDTILSSSSTRVYTLKE